MIDLKTILKLAAKPSTVEATRCVVFTGKSAMTMNGMDWIAGVPCEQPALTKPVAVPIAAIQKHLAKSRHLVVTPDGLTNGSNITTAFDFGKHDYAGMLDQMPKMPETKPVQFELDLDALDRVQVVAARQDIRYYLNGVLFDLTHGALVATDGSRLHMYRNRVPQVFDKAERPPVLVICPNAPLDFIVNSKEEQAQVMVWDADKEQQGCILINAGDAFVWVRKPIAGRYPDWTRVLPAEQTRPVVAQLDPVAMAEAASAVAKIHKANGTKKVGAQLHMGAQALIAVAEKAEHCERIGVPMVVSDGGPKGGALFADFQAEFLQDVADCVTPAARWCMAGANNSLLVVDGDFSGVVMHINHPVDLAPETAQAAPDAPQGLPAPVKAPRLAQKSRKQAQEAAQVSESEPVPAAVAAQVAQVVQVVQVAQEAAKKAPRKPKKAPQAAPVAA